MEVEAGLRLNCYSQSPEDRFSSVETQNGLDLRKHVFRICDANPKYFQPHVQEKTCFQDFPEDRFSSVDTHNGLDLRKHVFRICDANPKYFQPHVPIIPNFKFGQVVLLRTTK